MTLACAGLRISVPGRVLVESASLDIGAGEAVALMGPSGSGKSSLLNALAGIVPATADRLAMGGREVLGLSPAERSRFRLRHVGMVFQFAELLPELSAAENVALPLRFLGVSSRRAGASATSWLAAVGLADRCAARPDVLSGGERQRVAVARALVTEPDVVLADEPTGSLDAANAASVTSLLVDQARSTGAALLVATHDVAIARRFDRVIELVASELRPSTAA